MTKEQLIHELAKLRQQVEELKVIESKHEKVEEELLASQELCREQFSELDHLYNTAPVGHCFVDTDFRFVRINELLAAINGKSVAEHIGRSFREIIPELAEELEPLYRQVMESGEPILDLEVHGVTAAEPGVERSWVVNYYPVESDDGTVLGVNAVVQEITERKQMEDELKKHRDHLEDLMKERTAELEKTVKALEGEITERKQAEEALLASEAKIRSVVETAVDGVITIDERGIIESFNKSAEKLFGYKAEEIIGKNVKVLMPSPYRDEHDGYISKYKETEERKIIGIGREALGMHRDGTIFPMDLSVSEFYLGERRMFTGILRDITERKRAEEALRESEERFRRLSEASFEGISIAEEGRFLDANKQIAGMFGYEPPEIIGMSVTDLVAPESRELVRQRISSGHEEPYEIVALRKDGSTINVEVHGKSIPYEGRKVRVTAVRDITERKRAEESLRVAHLEVEKAREYLKTLIEDSLDAIISTDKEGKVVLFNEGAEVLLGYRREEVFGQRVTLLYESEERAKEVMHRMREKGGRVAGFETILRAKGGSIIPVLISASILYDEKGEEAGTVGFNKDLRERKRAKEQLIRSDKLAALGRLTTGVSHEILNPLNIITMSLQLMIEDRETPPEIVRQLRVLDEQAHRINKITQELLYFARQRKPERRWIDVNQTLSRTLSLFEKELRLQNVAVELKLSEGLEDVLADQDQLLQVVLNLLTNARDAMPGGGRLILSTEVVEADGQRFVEIRVEDTGPGIPPEHMEKLFDPFFTTKGEGKGTGLGLSICHGIIQAHGGSIQAESESGRGTTFIIQLPIELTTGIETD